MRGEREGALFVQEPGQARQVVDTLLSHYRLGVGHPGAMGCCGGAGRISLQPSSCLAGRSRGGGLYRLAGSSAANWPHHRNGGLLAAGCDRRLQCPVTPAAVRELRELGNAFDEMVKQIGRYQAGLRQYLAGITRSQEEERKRIAATCTMKPFNLLSP